MPIDVRCDDCGEEISCWPYSHQYPEKEHGLIISLLQGTVVCSDCLMFRVAKLVFKKMEQPDFSDRFAITLLPGSIIIRDRDGTLLGEISDTRT